MLTKKTSVPWSKLTLRTFLGQSKTDGMEPIGQLVLSGNTLYGATRLGGAHGQGSVFRMVAKNTAHTSWSEGVIYSFNAGLDGKGPQGVTLRSGHLFGLTEGGGDAGGPVFGGTLFELLPSGTGFVERIRHRFTGGTDGSTPQGTLMLSKTGTLFGLTYEGGGASSSGAFFQYVP
jgi:uncharacterized repeat protein (TIGR03803 family)